jgi:hypothetical protein
MKKLVQERNIKLGRVGPVDRGVRCVPGDDALSWSASTGFTRVDVANAGIARLLAVEGLPPTRPATMRSGEWGLKRAQDCRSDLVSR